MKEVAYGDIASLIGQEIGVSDWVEVSPAGKAGAIHTQPANCCVCDAPTLVRWTLINGTNDRPCEGGAP